MHWNGYKPNLCPLANPYYKASWKSYILWSSKNSWFDLLLVWTIFMLSLVIRVFNVLYFSFVPGTKRPANSKIYQNIYDLLNLKSVQRDLAVIQWNMTLAGYGYLLTFNNAMNIFTHVTLYFSWHGHILSRLIFDTPFNVFYTSNGTIPL